MALKKSNLPCEVNVLDSTSHRRITVSQVFTEVIHALLTEAYEGSSQVWFSSRNTGLFSSLQSVSAEQASKNGIAAHTEHLRWSLSTVNAMMRGERPAMDWTQSWTVKTVSKSEWQNLLEQLQTEYQALQTNLPPNPDLTDRMLITSGVALVAHAAYHLGAIRQMIATVQ
jgi:hypothetical protein